MEVKCPLCGSVDVGMDSKSGSDRCQCKVCMKKFLVVCVVSEMVSKDLWWDDTECLHTFDGLKGSLDLGVNKVELTRHQLELVKEIHSRLELAV